MTPAELKHLRHSAGLSLGQLSALIDVHTRTIRRWETGTKPIPRALQNMLMCVILGHVDYEPDRVAKR